MRGLSDVTVAAAAVFLLAATACGNEGGPSATSDEASTEQAGEEGFEEDLEEITVEDFDFDPADFSDSTNVDNQWHPLKPGTRFVYEGSTQEEDEVEDHRVVFIVTDLTKVVNGVRAVVGWDRDYSQGKLVESEIIFFAQDNDGNVWHLGQLREAYDDEEGEFEGSRAWLAGLAGAKAGIMMKAQPRPETPAYSQGYAPPPFFWDDHARVDATGQKTCVPAGCYENVLVIDEFEPPKPGTHQLKYYAPGVGYVRVGFRGDDPERETLELVELQQLSADALAEARAEALQIEARAYLYGLTPPAEHAPA